MMRLEHLPADVLEFSPLARAALSGGLARTRVVLPRRTDELPQPPDQLEPAERAALVDALANGLAPLAPHVAVLDAVRQLGQPGTFAVVTGQQPGLCASPLYSLYKAVHAVRLARRLSEAWERPVVALFWNHADDHDIAEVHHLNVLNKNLDLQKIGLAGVSSGRLMLSQLVLDEDKHRLAALRGSLAELVRDLPHGERALELFLPRHGETLARAFTRAFTELLGPLGLVVLEPDWIRPALSAQLARIVALEPVSALVRGAENVRALGFEPAIEPQAAALVFAIDARGRRALRPGGDGWKYDDEPGSRTSAELAAEIVQDPRAWSPGALLRPLVQDLTLPVAAYIGGYGELAYHVELPELRALAGVPQTPFVPRVSLTLVEPEVRRSLAKLDVPLGAVLRARGAFTGPVANTPPPTVLAEIARARENAQRELAGLREALESLDPTLGALLKRTQEQVKHSLESLAEKTERVHQNKSGKGKREERRLNNALFPRGEPQERVLAPLHFVARYGEDWIRQLAIELEPFGGEHIALHLGDDLGDEPV
jgi:bacillithiol biosynthesis cysteine-adding enzyme BshC